MRYAVVIEKALSNYGAYVPDLPGCVATGQTVEETLQQIQEAIEFHLEGMLLHGETIPEPSSLCQYVDVRVQQMRLSPPNRLVEYPQSIAQ